MVLTKKQKEIRKAQKKARRHKSNHPEDVEGYNSLCELVTSLKKEGRRQEIGVAVKKEKARMKKELEDMTEDEFLDQEYKENNEKNIMKVQEQARHNRVVFHNLIVKKIRHERLLKIREDLRQDYVRKLILHIDSETQ